MDAGVCCGCDVYNKHGVLITHVNQRTLYLCRNVGCGHYCCEKHREPNGYCYGCEVEER